MFSEGHNNSIVKGIQIDHPRQKTVDFSDGDGLSVYIWQYHYYVRENSVLYKIWSLMFTYLTFFIQIVS